MAHIGINIDEILYLNENIDKILCDLKYGVFYQNMTMCIHIWRCLFMIRSEMAMPTTRTGVDLRI